MNPAFRNLGTLGKSAPAVFPFLDCEARMSGQVPSPRFRKHTAENRNIVQQWHRQDLLEAIPTDLLVCLHRIMLSHIVAGNIPSLASDCGFGLPPISICVV